MRIFALLDSGTLVLNRIHDFASETQAHGFLAALAGGIHQPAHGQGDSAITTHFDGHLVGGTTNAAGLHFDHRANVIQCLLEHVEGFALALFRHTVERAIDDLLGYSLLAAHHNDVHELGERTIPELRIREDLTLGSFSSSSHIS